MMKMQGFQNKDFIISEGNRRHEKKERKKPDKNSNPAEIRTHQFSNICLK